MLWRCLPRAADSDSARSDRTTVQIYILRIFKFLIFQFGNRVMRVTEERFRELVRRAIDDLPSQFREKLENVEIIVEAKPTREQQGRFRGMLLGLYHGIPKSHRSTFIPLVPPDMIFLFQDNIQTICATEDTLQRQIRATLLHEIGHHFGMSEADLEGYEG